MSQRLAAFVGPRSAFYLAKWKNFDPAKSNASWNWPGFFFSFGWLAYRKMYLLASVALAGDWFLGFFGTAMQGSNWTGILLALVINLVTAMFGNDWYLRFSIQKVKAGSPGGTNVPAGVAFVVVSIVVGLLIDFAMGRLG